MSTILVDERTSRIGQARWTSGLWRNLGIVVPAFGLVLMVLACFLGPVFLPVPGPESGTFAHAFLPPFSAGHLLGTDQLGYDVLSRSLYGGRVSLEEGFAAQALGFLVGSVFGMFAGLKSGIVEVAVMRLTDMLLAFPALVLAIVVATYLGPSELHVIYALVFFTAPGQCRLAYAQSVKIRGRDFITMARVSGVRDRSILLRHLVPNVYPELLTFECLGVGVAILVAASLSFVGLGVPPPTPTWGNMIFSAESYLTNDPYLLIVPSAFLFFTIMCLNALGDAVRSKWPAG